jgi:hypothetical protein
VLTIPSIESTNRIGSYDSLYYNAGDIIDVAINDLLAQKDGLMVSYENGYVSIKSEYPTTAKLAIYTSAGQQCRMVNINLLTGEATQYVGDLPKGVYLVSVNAADGQTGYCKIVMK